VVACEVVINGMAPGLTSIVKGYIMTEPTIQNLFDLTGRVALITGGSGFLGNSLSRALAEAGASVVVASRELNRAQAVADALPVVGNAVHQAVVLDQMDEASLNSRI
jgi:NADP-dependent 3-hydroxy acid dehydrogenase YdfG